MAEVLRQTVSTVSAQAVIAIINQVWGDAANYGRAIASCESGFRTEAINYYNYDGVPDFGVFQLHGVKLMDARANIEYAYKNKYLPSGLQPWVSSKHCWQNRVNVI